MLKENQKAVINFENSIINAYILYILYGQLCIINLASRRVFDMIQQLIVEKTPIISVDEEIMNDNQFAKETDIPTTAYGHTESPEDLLKLFEFPDGI